MPFTATVLTMFPEAFPGALGVSLIGTAWREKGLWALETVDIRDFSTDKRGFLDDTPAGGGPGAVLKADVVARALDHVEGASGSRRPLLYMSARGQPLTQRASRNGSLPKGGRTASSSCAAVSRGWTSACSTRAGSRRSPSETRFSPAARRRRCW